MLTLLSASLAPQLAGKASPRPPPRPTGAGQERGFLKAMQTGPEGPTP